METRRIVSEAWLNVLQQNHVLNAANLQAPDLDNEIHPLLQHDRFVNTSTAVYNSYLPAFRLGSLWLTNRAFSVWWVVAALGVRVRDGRSGKEYLSLVANKSYEDQLVETAEHLKHLADLVQIKWEIIPPKRSDASDRSADFGETSIDGGREFLEHRPAAFSTELRHGIQIHIPLEFRDALLTPLSPERQQRMHFIIASSLVHEIAHALFLARFATRLATARYSRPAFHHSLTDPEVEEGYSWEMATFKHVVDIHGPVHLAATSPFTCFVCRPWEHSDIDRKREYFLSLRWINDWFLKQTWRRVAVAGRQALRPAYSGVRFVRFQRNGKWNYVTDSTPGGTKVWKMVYAEQEE